MEITRTEVFVLGDPPPDGPADEARIAELAFLRLHTDDGISGLSEIFSVPPGVAKAVLDGPDSLFGRVLVGEAVATPERLRAKLYNGMLHGNRRGWAVICIGAAEVALWDLYGKALGRPVYQLLGDVEWAEHQVVTGSSPGEVVPYGTIVSTTYDRATVLREQTDRVAQLRDVGYRAVKIEPQQSTPETVVEAARLARQALGPDGILAVDVGYLWNDVGVAQRVAERLAELDVFFLETPFPVDSLAAYARLSARSPLRIAAGEHSVTRWEFLDLMDRGGVLVAQPYVTTCGGLAEAKRIVELALPRGVLVCPGNWSTHVLGAATVHLAATSPISPVVESVPSQIYWSPLRKAIAEVGLPVADGRVALPTAPGLGVELPPDLIAHFRIG